MGEAIPAAVLTAMSCELGNEEIGATVRLMARLLETKRPISLRTAHISSGLDRASWQAMEENVLRFFIVENESITLGEDLDDTEEQCDVNLRSRQGEMDLHVRRTRRPKVPQYATAEKPQVISIRKAIFDQAVRLFGEAGMSENTARSVLAMMLKKYPEGDVAMAVSDACQKDAIAEPHTWILGRLKSLHKKRQSSSMQVPKAPNPERLVTPERTGISSAKAAKIQQRNAGLKLDLSHS